jgi:phage-related protein
MEEMIAIPVSEYERLKAAEKRLNELRQEQINKANQEIEEIKRRSHEKMMQSFYSLDIERCFTLLRNFTRV